MASLPIEKLPRASGHLGPLLERVQLPAFPGPLCAEDRSPLSRLSPTASESLISHAGTLRAHVAVRALLSPLSPQTVKAPAEDLCCPPLLGALSPNRSFMSF